MGKTTERGYGNEHQKLRKRWAREVAAGVVLCARCGRLIAPGTPWDLDHAPGKVGYLGPSHRRCNRATSTRRRERGREDDDLSPTITSREW
jgi:hypothetical protein